jgi:hypothetical protein
MYVSHMIRITALFTEVEHSIQLTTNYASYQYVQGLSSTCVAWTFGGECRHKYSTRSQA